VLLGQELALADGVDLYVSVDVGRDAGGPHHLD
jgi:hypothetical protein